MWYKKYAVDEYMCQAKESIKDSWWCTAINDLQYGNVLSARIFSRKPKKPVKIRRNENLNFWHFFCRHQDLGHRCGDTSVTFSRFRPHSPLWNIKGSYTFHWCKLTEEREAKSLILNPFEHRKTSRKKEDGKSSKRTLKYCSGMLKISHNVILQFLSLLQNSCKEKFCITTTAEFNLAKGGHGKSCLV